MECGGNCGGEKESEENQNTVLVITGILANVPKKKKKKIMKIYLKKIQPTRSSIFRRGEGCACSIREPHRKSESNFNLT